MKKRTRWMLIGSVVVVVLIIVSLVTSDTALVIETAYVQRDTLRVTVAQEGRTRVRERYVVAAPVAGRLSRIALDEGDALTEGTLVARLYPVPEGPRTAGIARAQIAAAEAQRNEAAARLEEAQARLAQVQREVERSRALAADSIFSQQELEQIELAAASARQQQSAAQAALRAAEANVAAARAALLGANPQEASGGTVPIRAPSAGKVLRVWEKSERVVQAGTPLIEIGDAGGLEVVVDVLSEEAARIKPGDAVYFDEWGGDETLRGRVRLVEPDAFTKISALGVEEQRVNIIADLFAPPAALGSGYRVEANIVTWTGEGVLTVPTSALFQRDGAWYVFAVEDERAVLRSLQIGHRAAEAAEVMGGLREGEQVILFPSDQVENGVHVQPR